MAAPTTTYGTFTLLDTLAAANQTVAKFGLDTAFDYIRQTFDVHNMLMRDMRAPLVTDTRERLVRGASNARMQMQKLSEFGTPDAQKVTAGVPIGFPLERWGDACQFTGLALKRMRTEEMAAQAKAMMDADVLNFLLSMQQAVYRPANYNSIDRFVDYQQVIPLPIKALANADGFPIPPGPNGEFFDGATHNHYMVAATPGTFAAADCDALLQNVREHQGNGKGFIGVNQAESATISGFAKFKAVVDTRVIQPNTSSYVNPSFAGLDTTNTNNRLIGIYDGAEVWVKPWVLAGYPAAWWGGAGITKPLAFRYDPDLPADLTLTYEGEVHDLKADVYERYYGLGVWNRIVMAVLDIAHGSYTAPL